MGEAQREPRGCCTSHSAPACRSPCSSHAHISVPPRRRQALPATCLSCGISLGALQSQSTALAGKTLGSKPALPHTHSLTHQILIEHLLCAWYCSRSYSNSTEQQKSLPSLKLHLLGRESYTSGEKCCRQSKQSKAERACYTMWPGRPKKVAFQQRAHQMRK